MSAFYVALICIAAGELLHARRKHLAGLLWMLSFFVRCDGGYDTATVGAEDDVYYCEDVTVR